MAVPRMRALSIRCGQEVFKLCAGKGGGELVAVGSEGIVALEIGGNGCDGR